MKKQLTIFLLTCAVGIGCAFSNVFSSDHVDLVCFSYDRPLQMYAFLESAQLRVKGVQDAYVLFRASTLEYESAYRDVAARFPNVKWVKQGTEPNKDFKPLSLSILRNSTADYILFAVDDIIVTDDVDLSMCIDALKKTGAYAFYLRLGKNITYCYACRKPSPIPPLKSCGNDIFEWCFAQGTGDWRYPNSVDLTLFRRDQVLRDICDLDFSNPNFFESKWAGRAVIHRHGLCFSTSKMINIPINVVQNTFANRNMHLYTKEDMFKFYTDGYKIDVQKLYRISHNSAHFEVVPTLIKR